MVYTASTSNLSINPLINGVATVTQQIKTLSVDDQLGLLWVIYTEIGRSITPAAPGAARLQFAEGLLNQVKAMTPEQQLTFMRNLVNQVSTPQTRAYGVLTNNTKLAFWYQLAELMEKGEVIPVPVGYTLSQSANLALMALQKLDFNQQITVLRNAVVDMGVDPLA
jgi:hypothetical protein